MLIVLRAHMFAVTYVFLCTHPFFSGHLVVHHAPGDIMAGSVRVRRHQSLALSFVAGERGWSACPNCSQTQVMRFLADTSCACVWVCVSADVDACSMHACMHAYARMRVRTVAYACAHACMHLRSNACITVYT